MPYKSRKLLLAFASFGLTVSLSGCGGDDPPAVASNTATSTGPSTTAPSTMPSASPIPAETQSAPSAPAKSNSSYGGEATSGQSGAAVGNSGGGPMNSGGGPMNSGGGPMNSGGGPMNSGGGPMNSGGGPMNSGGTSGIPVGGSGGPPGMSGVPGIGGPAKGMGPIGDSSSSGPMVGSSGGPGGAPSGTPAVGGPAKGMPSFGPSAPEMGSFPGGGMAGFGAANDGFAVVSSFLQQNCFNCHSSGNAKGGVTLDRLTSFQANPQMWSNVLEQLESGAMPPGNVRVDASRKAAVVEFIRSALGGSELAENDVEKTFMERAEQAFRKGDIKKAESLFYAQLITADDSEAKELADNIKLYVPNPSKADDLKPAFESGIQVKPRLVTKLKFAVGIIAKLGTGVTEIRPIGVKQFTANAGGGMGMGGPGMGGIGGMGNQQAATPVRIEAFEDFTGDLGRAFIAAYESRLSDGKYGSLFASESVDDRSESDSRFNNQGLGGQANFGGNQGNFGMLDEPGMSGGPGGMSGGPGGGPGGAPGGMSGAPIGGGGPMGMAGGGGGLGFGAAGSQPNKTKPNKPIANGLLYLGKADNAQALIKKANEAGVDGLFIFDIDSNKQRQFVVTDTKVRFLLPSGRAVAQFSNSLNNKTIEIAQARGTKEADDLNKQIDLLFNRLDAVLPLGDTSKLASKSAIKQLHGLLHSGADPLEVMGQARMYHVKDIISSEQLETIYQVVMESNDGITVATGDSDARKLVMASFTEKL